MPKSTQIGMLLATGLVLSIATIYSLPMQQALACGKSCDGGDDCCGGSLVNVEDNLNTKILNGNEVKVEVLSDNDNNNIANVNDVNVLSKNYVKDVVKDVDVLKDITIKSNDVIEDHSNVLVVNDNIKDAFKILLD